MDIYEESVEMHKKNKGKLEVRSKVPVRDKHDLSLAYTPGVAEVSRRIAKDKTLVYDYTIKHNSVAVVSDGSAVLGLGNIGPEAALPVMEGKAILFKEFADIDAFPVCLATQDTEEIIKTVRYLAPSFGGINLEDISAPRCFEIEERLQDVGIPVFHDDQHGTAIAILAAIINASKLAGKKVEELRIVINGAGAAGMAITRLLLCLGVDKKICTSVKEIILCDSKGIIHKDRADLNKYKAEIAKVTNARQRKGTLDNALDQADVFIGVSTGNVLKKEMIKKMADKPVVFAMANPTPEIMPDDAKDGGAYIAGTGRSDYPNQINNVLVFPGVFRGALDSRAPRVTNEMKIAAAYALAGYQKPTPEQILPSTLDKNVAKRVAEAVKTAAME